MMNAVESIGLVYLVATLFAFAYLMRSDWREGKLHDACRMHGYWRAIPVAVLMWGLIAPLLPFW